MSALALYNPKSSKITASSSPIKIREKSKDSSSKKERGGFHKGEEKSESNDKLTLQKMNNQAQRVEENRKDR